ncbi:MAG: hypothetical protein L0221_18900, partial [Chloroflexi bacterium]|nr:hypothetical protein [Chloroflexota bacterium]
MTSGDVYSDMHDEITPVRGVVYQAWKPIPGPVDRVSFYDEQRRHRRATWRLTIFCSLAVLLTGVPVSLVLTPVVHTVALLFLVLAGQFVRVPDAAWQSYRSLFLAIFDTVELLDRQPIAEQVPGLENHGRWASDAATQAGRATVGRERGQSP